jgi:hypothetical protein
MSGRQRLDLKIPDSWRRSRPDPQRRPDRVRVAWNLRLAGTAAAWQYAACGQLSVDAGPELGVSGWPKARRRTGSALFGRAAGSVRRSR